LAPVTRAKRPERVGSRRLGFRFDMWHFSD
jgi:hypothetical protein